MILAINNLKHKFRTAYIQTHNADIYFEIRFPGNRSKTRITKSKINTLIKKHFHTNLSNFLTPNNTFMLQGFRLTNQLQITVTKVISVRSEYSINAVTEFTNHSSPSHSLTPEEYLKKITREEIQKQANDKLKIKGKGLVSAICAVNDLPLYIR